MTKILQDYISNWQKIDMGEKPVNEPIFYAEFKQFLQQSPPTHFDFKGENNYCGYTAIVYVNDPSYRFFHNEYDDEVFEIAYDSSFVKVFTGKHNGYYVPEYLSLSNEDAFELLSILHRKMLQWAGFTNT